MVLELRAPQGADLQALLPLGPVFLSYFLSFGNLGIYAVAFVSAFVVPLVAVALHVAVAVIWFVPDRRIERTLSGRDSRAVRLARAGNAIAPSARPRRHRESALISRRP